MLSSCPTLLPTNRSTSVRGKKAIQGNRKFTEILFLAYKLWWLSQVVWCVLHISKVKIHITLSNLNNHTPSFLGICTVNDTIVFALTREVGIGARRHRGSGHGDPPGPRPACPSVGWGGSDRTHPSPVWGYTLEITALEKATERGRR